MEGVPISEALAQKIGRAFTLPAAEVVSDARQIAAWNGPADDLIVSLERRHDWNAERAVRYLLSLCSAIAGELGDS